MPSASSFGTVFLFGEHAVVYGFPALVASVDRKISVSAERNRRDTIRIRSSLGSATIRINDIGRAGGKLNYVIRAIHNTFQHIGKTGGMDVNIKSSLPPSSGLGTSSAVCVATIRAVSSAFDSSLEEKDLINLALKTERDIQGLASRAGVTCALFGGYWLIEGERATKIEAQGMEAVVGWSGIPSSTRKMVRFVGKLKEKQPVIVDVIFNGIGWLTRVGVNYLRSGNVERLGQLMNLNHALLASLKIVPPKIERMLQACWERGALGAKITGAGGGGCIIALGKTEKILKAIEETGGKAFKCKLGSTS